jgi:hypothetical protein
MSRKVNSLQNNLSQQNPEIPSASSSAPLLDPASTNSATSFSGEDWLSLSDFDTNQHKTWSLGDVVLGYQNASELLYMWAVLDALSDQAANYGGQICLQLLRPPTDIRPADVDIRAV